MSKFQEYLNIINESTIDNSPEFWFSGGFNFSRKKISSNEYLVIYSSEQHGNKISGVGITTNKEKLKTIGPLEFEEGKVWSKFQNIPNKYSRIVKTFKTIHENKYKVKL